MLAHAMLAILCPLFTFPSGTGCRFKGAEEKNAKGEVGSHFLLLPP